MKELLKKLCGVQTINNKRISEAPKTYPTRRSLSESQIDTFENLEQTPPVRSNSATSTLEILKKIKKSHVKCLKDIIQVQNNELNNQYGDTEEELSIILASFILETMQKSFSNKDFIPNAYIIEPGLFVKDKYYFELKIKLLIQFKDKDIKHENEKFRLDDLRIFLLMDDFQSKKKFKFKKISSELKFKKNNDQNYIFEIICLNEEKCLKFYFIKENKEQLLDNVNREIKIFKKRHDVGDMIRVAQITIEREHLSDNFVLILPFFKAETLTDILKKNSEIISNHQVIDIMIAVVEEFIYLKNLGIIHNDVNSNNLLFYEYNGKLSCKCVDFYNSIIEGDVTLDKVNTTLFTASPELIRFNGFSLEKLTYHSDIFSLGIIFFLICKKPFKDLDYNQKFGLNRSKKENWDKFLENELLGFVCKSKNLFVDLIKKMLAFEAENRISYENLKQDLYVLKDDILKKEQILKNHVFFGTVRFASLKDVPPEFSNNQCSRLAADIAFKA